MLSNAPPREQQQQPRHRLVFGCHGGGRDDRAPSRAERPTNGENEAKEYLLSPGRFDKALMASLPELDLEAFVFKVVQIVSWLYGKKVKKNGKEHTKKRGLELKFACIQSG